MCVSSDDYDLLEAARFTNRNIRLLGQAPAPRKCILFSTSVRVRGLMRDWVLSGDKWTVKLDTRDLGGAPIHCLSEEEYHSGLSRPFGGDGIAFGFCW